MSVRSETYILIGVELGRMKVGEDSYEYLEKLRFPWCGKGAADTFGVLFDGMNSNYIMAGYCHSVSNPESGGFDERATFNLSMGDPPQWTLDKAKEVQEWLRSQDFEKFTSEQVALHVLTHYH